MPPLDRACGVTKQNSGGYCLRCRYDGRLTAGFRSRPPPVIQNAPSRMAPTKAIAAQTASTFSRKVRSIFLASVSMDVAGIYQSPVPPRSGNHAAPPKVFNRYAPPIVFTTYCNSSIKWNLSGAMQRLVRAIIDRIFSIFILQSVICSGPSRGGRSPSRGTGPLQALPGRRQNGR